MIKLKGLLIPRTYSQIGNFFILFVEIQSCRCCDNMMLSSLSSKVKYPFVCDTLAFTTALTAKLVAV